MSVPRSPIVGAPDGPCSTPRLVTSTTVARAIAELDDAHIVARLSGIGTAYEVYVVPELDLFALTTNGEVLSTFPGTGGASLETALRRATILVVTQVTDEVGR